MLFLFSWYYAWKVALAFQQSAGGHWETLVRDESELGKTLVTHKAEILIVFKVDSCAVIAFGLYISQVFF